MTSLELKKEISTRYSSRIFKTADSAWIINECARLADIGEVHHAIYTACYGIQWAVQSGRLSGTIALRIRYMEATEVFKLITDTASACEHIGDVPAYLIGRLAEKSP